MSSSRSAASGSSDAAVARKRRIQQRRRAAPKDDEAWEPDTKRARNDAGSDDDEDSDKPRLVPSVRGIKKQTRYEPGVPMTKEELTAWRKEARRVRNRESAAASRQKTRQRIDELELVVQELETKYKSALHLITKLEQDKACLQAQVQGSSPQEEQVKPSVSPESSPKLSPTVTTVDPSNMSLAVPFMPSTAPLSTSTSSRPKYQREHLLLPPAPQTHAAHNPPIMISRPTAA